MKKIYFDPLLPKGFLPVDVIKKVEKQISSSIEDADIVFLYLHTYPQMQLRFQEFENILTKSKSKHFFLMSWFDFDDFSQYKIVFEEHFTPNQIGMWQDNNRYIQLPASLDSIFKDLNLI